MTARKPTRTCPVCASADVVPIVWGLPNEEDFEKAEAGEFALGGCCVGPDDPQWHCKACGKDFGGRSRPNASARSVRHPERGER
jgi:hypothetical protein